VGTLVAKTAFNRKKPIPAYCEMGSVNPLFIFPDALKTKSNDIAQGLVASVTLGAGQFCTNPGLVFLIGDKPQMDTFIGQLVTTISSVPPAPMLTPDILKAYQNGLEDLAKVKGIKWDHHNASSQAGASIFSVSFVDFLGHSKRLQQELFGPSTLLVKIDPSQDLSRIPAVLEGQLTASFHATDLDAQRPALKQLINNMEERVGRLIWGGYPTGVEVNSSIHHGGPWPAASDGGRTTSVGTRAIFRWVRPLSYQGFPEQFLPPELTESNPNKINRMVSGKIVQN